MQFYRSNFIIGTNFQGVKTGQSHRQVNILIAATIVCPFILYQVRLISFNSRIYVTFRIFKWLIQSIQSNPGTSFRKANLTDADFSHAEVQNTDFSLAVLTGACIFNWIIKHHNQLTNVYCKYVYLEPAQQNRQPTEGNFQPGELEQVLIRFTIR